MSPNFLDINVHLEWVLQTYKGFLCLYVKKRIPQPLNRMTREHNQYKISSRSKVAKFGQHKAVIWKSIKQSKEDANTLILSEGRSSSLEE